ncbi:hypothetical protein RF11_07204 [Thelohanellus kitauei]|uniref:Uncharacterized protein n=1 Tax=Thelohanellus kitauei TaxID=669202 RepID=A0A0C2IZU0_THEKT|nr:hypothetical protein RF11_07204 [Thelohanellus kitauei]
MGPNSGKQDSIMCRNRSCRYPSTGFTFTFRKRNLKSPTEERLGLQDQNTLSLPTLRCKNCKTYLTPRTGGFLSYMDRTRRANCKLLPEKILQIIFHWATQSSSLTSLITAWRFVGGEIYNISMIISSEMGMVKELIVNHLRLWYKSTKHCCVERGELIMGGYLQRTKPFQKKKFKSGRS